MRDIFRPRRMWRRRGELRDSYDVVIIGGGSHGLATAYYLGQLGDHERRGARAGLHRLGRGRAQHDDPALQLQDARGRALLRRERQALRAALGASSNFNLLFSQCGHLTLAHSDRAMFVMANRAEVNRLHGIDSQLVDAAEVKRLCPPLNVSDDVTYPIMGALYHPPGGIIRHDAVVWGYARGADRAGVEIHPYTEVHGLRALATGAITARAHQPRHDQGRAGDQRHRGLEHAACATMAGVRAADHDPHPAGVRDRAGQAAARRRDRLLADARLHLAVRPRRVRDGLGDRAVDDLPDAGHAQLPPGPHPPHARAVPAARARAAAAQPGPGCATSRPTTARSSARTEVENFHVSAGWGTYGFKAAPIVGKTLAELVAHRAARPS